MITSDSLVEDVLTEYPALTKVFIQFGLPCLVCGEAHWGTLRDLVQGHAIDIDKLIMTLNDRKDKIHEKI